MSDGSSIEWLKRPGTKPATWNPVRGCTRVSRGCGAADGGGCYAEVLAARFSLSAEELREAWLAKPQADAMAVPAFKDQWGHGFAETIRKPDGTSVRRWTGKVELIEEKLLEPLHWREPRTIFANSTSDLFHEKLPDEAIYRCFAVMAACPQHDFLILTKRPERMRSYLTLQRTNLGGETLGAYEHIYSAMDRLGEDSLVERHPYRKAFPNGMPWPLPNVWLGTSCEDQATADERIPHLLATPAAIRFVSAEPLLGPIEFLDAHPLSFGSLTVSLPKHPLPPPATTIATTLGEAIEEMGGNIKPADRGLDWIIVGGESGPNARRHDLAWDRSIIAQCRAAGIPVFEKQLGSRPVGWWTNEAGPHVTAASFKDKKGGDISEWPVDLRIREWPEVRAA